MLNKVSIKGFKSIRCLEDFEMRPINVLIGANGSGKTNFLDALELLRVACDDIFGTELDSYVARRGGAEMFLHFGAETTGSISLGVLFDDERRYGFDLSKASDGYGLTSVGEHVRASETVESLRVYNFHDASGGSFMNKTNMLHDNRRLRPDGSNLAAFLYLLREKHATSYNFIRGAVRLVAPFFDDFILEPDALNENTIRLRWKHVGSDSRFDVAQFSDGVKRFIALATLFLQPSAYLPPMILIDKPEIGLPPNAIGLLSEMIRSASVDSQVIFETQSTNLLDGFMPEDVVVVERVKGASEYKRLDSASLTVWLQDYSLSDLWYMGDIGGDATPAWRERLR